jgi:hypothetical protein
MKAITPSYVAEKKMKKSVAHSFSDVIPVNE